MKTRTHLISAALAFGTAGCSTVAHVAFSTVDWVMELTVSAVELGVGVVAIPFDEGATFKSGTRGIRATMVRPLVALEKQLDTKKRLRVLVLWRQSDGSIARASTDFLDGVSQGTFYEAFYLPVTAPKPQSPQMGITPPEVVLKPLVISDDKTEHVVIDDKQQALSIEEVKPMLTKQPNLQPAKISEQAIEFLKKLGSSEGYPVSI